MKWKAIICIFFIAFFIAAMNMATAFIIQGKNFVLTDHLIIGSFFGLLIFVFLFFLSSSLVDFCVKAASRRMDILNESHYNTSHKKEKVKK
jgi:ABC-type bacteriocin/lantibiotic exporter with double-glycine peptidase domain